MATIISLLKGRKTHLIAIVGLILGILQGFDIFTVPAEAWPILGALGLSTLRAGVQSTVAEIEQSRK